MIKKEIQRLLPDSEQRRRIEIIQADPSSESAVKARQELTLSYKNYLGGMVVRYPGVRRDDRDDMIHELLIEIHGKMHLFDTSQKTSVKTWVAVCAKNKLSGLVSRQGPVSGFARANNNLNAAKKRLKKLDNRGSISDEVLAKEAKLTIKTLAALRGIKKSFSLSHAQISLPAQDTSEKHAQIERMWQGLESLDETERKLISVIYLNGSNLKAAPQEARLGLSKKTNTTTQEISRREKLILKKLRKFIIPDEAQDYSHDFHALSDKLPKNATNEQIETAIAKLSDLLRQTVLLREQGKTLQEIADITKLQNKKPCTRRAINIRLRTASKKISNMIGSSETQKPAV